MLRQKKNMLDGMIFELENEDVVSSDPGDIKEPVVKPQKKKKRAKKKKKNDRLVPNALQAKQVLKFLPTCNTSNGNVNNISTDNEYIILSDDDDQCEEKEPLATEVKATVLDDVNDVNEKPLENNVPLVSVRFSDVRIAKLYKSQIKEFIEKLISQPLLNEPRDGDTDLELNIFSKELGDITDIPSLDHVDECTDNIFVIDTNPTGENDTDIPAYSNKFGIMKDGINEENSRPARKAMMCFNCDGPHNLKDCLYKKDYNRINQKRKAITKVGRYHTEDEQRFGHLYPGRISRKLRAALNLHKNQLPLHVYRMRLLGYPPGWIEAARIEHSGMNLFDSLGNQIAEPEDEDGEIFEAGSKDKFDIKKIYDFPGFNVPASSRYKEECEMYGCPPMLDHQSKMAMLQEMAPNAMQAYKRKKLKLIDTGYQDMQIEADIDMEISSDADEMNGPEFPFVPPLPDEPPPPAENLPPPPPDLPKNPLLLEINSRSGSQSEEGFTSKVKENGVTDRESSPPLSDLEKHKKVLLEALAEGDNLDASHTEEECVSLDPSNMKSSMGMVKSSEFGTPLINASSPFSKLPSGDKFSKNICDIINFENLPDSTGKYKQMSGLIKKVRDVVTKIHYES